MAGEVVEVGSGVQKFKPDDKVITVLSVYVSAHEIKLDFY